MFWLAAFSILLHKRNTNLQVISSSRCRSFFVLTFRNEFKSPLFSFIKVHLKENGKRYKISFE